MTGIAQWITDVFAGYDQALLSFWHDAAEACGPVLKPFMYFISLLGNAGIFLILTGLVLLIWKQTRRTGITMLAALLIGSLITNLCLKNLVMRPRPFQYLEEYKSWWNACGSLAASGYSFPSGHTTAATAAMTALVAVRGKKWILPAVLFVALMGSSRNYFQVHYPSDILGGMLCGLIAGILAWLIVKAVLMRIQEKRNTAEGKK